MKICPKCGKYNGDTDENCTACGNSLTNIKSISSIRDELKIPYNESTEQQSKQNIHIDKSSKAVFVDADEEVYAELGSGYLQNIITMGNISSVKAVLTQKRLYLSGKTYIISQNTLSSFKESKIVNVEDITGTGFVYIENKLLLIISIITIIATLIVSVSQQSLNGIKYGFLGLLVAAFFLAMYFLNRKSLFKIEYAGGSIGFNAKWFDVQDSENFQKKIYQVKDKRKKEIIKECLKEKENT